MRDNINLLSGVFFIVSSLAVLTLSTTSCDPICEGYLRVINPISDITMEVGDTLYIDLTNPPVFESSEATITYSYTYLSQLKNSYLDIKSKNINGKSSLALEIIGFKIGNSLIRFNAQSADCLENSTNFTITVIDLN